MPTLRDHIARQLASFSRRTLDSTGRRAAAVAVTVCRDDGDAVIIVTPDHWHALLRARAIEHQCWVLAPAQWGPHGDKGLVRSYGHSLVVDPSEEKLKSEFSGVKRTHIPIQAVIRIDEVEQAGQNKIISDSDSSGNITPFPMHLPPGQKSDKT